MDLEDFIVSNNILPLGSLVYLLFCVSRRGWAGKAPGGGQHRQRIEIPQRGAVLCDLCSALIVLFIFVMGYWDKFF